MDLLALAFEIVFEGSLVVAGALLLLTYVAFSRMNRDVRRARLFIMADRVKRFLGSFTVGFLLIAGASILTIAGLPTAGVIFPIVIFLFLGAIVFGSLELYLIVRPRPSAVRAVGKVPRSRQVPEAPDGERFSDGADGGEHAAR